MHDKDIVIRGAREHNLRNIDLRLPRNKLIVMTGVSGSGKSSLAFDTLYAEGQRRYVESLSSYARQFLGQMPKPEVDLISGLAPSISIQQKTSGRNPRSTVGTITEIYDYLRVLFARVGTQYCRKCDRPISAQSSEQIVETIRHRREDAQVMILAPMVQQQKGEFRDFFQDLLKQGYLRARVDGRIISLTDDLRLDRQMKHTIEVVVDRLSLGTTGRARLAEAVQSALKLGEGQLLVVERAPDGADETSTGAERLYSAKHACPDCGISYEPPSPQLFSFNSPIGMCLECNGLGHRHDFVMDLLIEDEKKSIAKGVIGLVGPLSKMGRWRKHIYRGAAAFIEKQLKLPEGSLLKKPWAKLSEKARHLWLYGTGDRRITFHWKQSGGTWRHGGSWPGVINELLDDYRKSNNPMRRRQLEKYMQFVRCPACSGDRLNSQAQNVRLETANSLFRKSHETAALSLPGVCGLSIGEAAEFFSELTLNDSDQWIAAEVLKEIRGRLGFLLRCGLDYLTLDRTAPTLSGGESQRIRLAGQIGCGLVGVVYILDEPSIGLHPRDNEMLLESLCDLRDQGNTVIVVEHDEDTMRAADHIVDFGPGPGVRGGEVVAEGDFQTVTANERSVTAAYLSGRESIAVPSQRRDVSGPRLTVREARHHNLQGVDVEFPLGTFIGVTGVSGSGKSSLINDILWQVLNRDLNRGNGNPGQHTGVEGLEHLDKAIDIDQSPIGRTPRSNPATYVKLFDQIRSLYANLPESRLRGHEPGRFSFNVTGGRCEACEGHGSNKLEMDFLADVWVTCPVCQGHRFNRETLDIRFKEKSIADVLEMDVQEAMQHFENIPKIRRLLQALHDVGLDYLKLGQPSPSLSGGEAQRVKLARELGKRSTGRTLYVLDEPTTGLHFADVAKLLEVLHGLVEVGNTVIVVEHNLDVIKTADWLIDLGPEGGAGGGKVVAEGTPEHIAACEESYTGKALASLLNVKPSRRKGGRKKKAAGTLAGRWQSAVAGNDRDRLTDTNEIVVRGASQHNLQQLDLTVPREKMTVFCGPSGSGKSSLAMDTLYAEGQRRYVESLSSYARQFLGQMPKPKVEHIHGLSPAIAIEQKSIGHTPRSTVGTVTEVYDYLRVLFARLGTQHCPECAVPVRPQTTDEVIDRLLSHPAGTRLLLLAPQDVAVGQSYDRLWERLREQGFRRVRIDGETCELEAVPQIDRKRRHEVEVVVDRVTVDSRKRRRLADSVEQAFDLGKGLIRAAVVAEDRPEPEWRIEPFSLYLACHSCGRSFEELAPHNFSFNSPLGWCFACEGLGVEEGTRLTALLADDDRSLAEAVVAAWPDPRTNDDFRMMLEAMSKSLEIPLDRPWRELDSSHQRYVLQGTGERWFELPDFPGTAFQYKGLYPAMGEAARVSYEHRQSLYDLVGEIPCSQCGGSRLRDDAAAVYWQGKTMYQLGRMPLGTALEFLKGVKLKGRDKRIAGDLLQEAVHRMSFLVEVGLHYLTLDRTLPTLSGGETQRIRLAGQIGRALTGVLYVLDEPTIGLHPSDNGRLLGALKKLRDLGNTLVLVEHDREVIESADRLYDFGPGAGRLGGRITAEGTPKQLARRNSTSLTGQYLSGREEIPIPTQRRMPSGNPNAVPPADGWLELLGARMHNLRNVDLRIPLGCLVAVTGVSGSGKSSLIESTLAPAVARRLHRSGNAAGPFDELNGTELLSKVIVVDQQPLGNTPASNPATYTGVFELIRELFARMPEARVRGYTASRFSFNRSGGRCEDCEGLGTKCIEMHFLPDVWVECETCRGKRYNPETLAVLYRGKSIADVLEMPIGEALELFDNIPKIRAVLATLAAIGLDYLTLGQSAPTLSGGEAQRVKLASELSRPQSGRTLYLLDEPTTGLHFDDVRKLLKILESLVSAGNSVVIVEHNLDVIKTADWVIDLGPGAGSEGGWIVTAGTPEDVVEYAKLAAPTAPKSKSKSKPRGGQAARSENAEQRSLTGEILATVLSSGTRAQREIFDAEQAAAKRTGDLDMRQVGKDAQMPWQKDGRRWHIRDRVALNGQPCRWSGAALEQIIDHVSADDRFADVNWNDRSVVAMTATGAPATWFLHALTGDPWAMKLKLRVKRGTFDEQTLRERLGWAKYEELDEVEAYSRSERIGVRNLKGPWQEVSFDVMFADDVSEDFLAVLDEARDAYLGFVSAAATDKVELMPWKKLGRKWHASRKGFPSTKRVKWEPTLVEDVLQLIDETLSGLEADWTGKQSVSWRAKKTVRATVHTKRREGVDVTLYVDAGRVELGQIAAVGTEREITPHRNGHDAVKIRFDRVEQLGVPSLREVLSSITDTNGS